MVDTIILKVCKCNRVFDPISGECDREPLPFVRPNWKFSSQRCIKCDKDFYVKRALLHLKKNGIKNVE